MSSGDCSRRFSLDAWRGSSADSLRSGQDRLARPGYHKPFVTGSGSGCATGPRSVPFSEGGRPVVPNGLSLCKIHHAAYDANILGVRPDLVAEIRADVMREIDGPMLTHGLQALDGVQLIRPRSTLDAPDAVGLELRYERFRQAG